MDVLTSLKDLLKTLIGILSRKDPKDSKTQKKTLSKELFLVRRVNSPFDWLGVVKIKGEPLPLKI